MPSDPLRQRSSPNAAPCAVAAAVKKQDELAFAIRYAGVMAEPLTCVIANHLGAGSWIVLEGDFILRALAVQSTSDGIPTAGRVQSLFIYEPEEQIARTGPRPVASEGE